MGQAKSTPSRALLKHPKFSSRISDNVDMDSTIRRALLLKCLFFCAFLVPGGVLSAQDLSLGPGDIRIEQRADGGFHLFVRKKQGVESVLLVESTKDPAMREDNFAFRAKEYNPVNGDERRILDGAFLEGEQGRFSIVDSSLEEDSNFGEAFHLYIPWIVEYGYPWSRSGELYITDGTYLNIRSFAMGFADYRGEWTDNPFILRVTQAPLEGPPEANYMKETLEAFSSIASGGTVYFSRGPEDIVEKIRDALPAGKGKSVDLVIVLDTTSSMSDDIAQIRRDVLPVIEDLANRATALRVGMVYYKDYFETYLTNRHDFTGELTRIQRRLDHVRVFGGRDIPEAVYEALYEAATAFPWAAEERVVLLIGDAPPHPKQRGAVSKEGAMDALLRREIQVQAIILPQ